MRGQLMQPAQEGSPTNKLIRAFEDPLEVKLFVEAIKNYGKSIEALPPDLLFLYSDRFFPTSHTGFVDGITESIDLGEDFISVSEVKKWINLQPNMKGVLAELQSGFIWKFRYVKPYTSKELFDIRFDREKVKDDLKEWLYYKIRDIYVASDCDDP